MHNFWWIYVLLSLILWICVLFCCFWRVFEISNWIIVIFSKYQPPKHTFGQMHPSSQLKHMGGGWFLIYSQWLNIVPCYRTGYGQVFRFLCAQIAPQNHNWDAGSFLTAKNIKNGHFWCTSDGFHIMFTHSFYSDEGFFKQAFLQFVAKNDPKKHILLYRPFATTKIPERWIIFNALPVTELCTLWQNNFEQFIWLLKAFHNL